MQAASSPAGSFISGREAQLFGVHVNPVCGDTNTPGPRTHISELAKLSSTLPGSPRRVTAHAMLLARRRSCSGSHPAQASGSKAPGARLLIAAPPSHTRCAHRSPQTDITCAPPRMYASLSCVLAVCRGLCAVQECCAVAASAEHTVRSHSYGIWAALPWVWDRTAVSYSPL